MDWKDIITWLLVIIGWFVVHTATVRREDLKEKRDTTLRIIQEIREVEDIAIEFQTSSEFLEENYDILVWKIHRITSALHRPPLKFLKISTNIIISFRQNLTSNTDKSSFITQSHTSENIRNIHEAADNLTNEIETQKYIYFT